MKFGHKPLKIGTRRRSIRFAWRPVLTADGYWVWMERYLVVKVFTACYYWSGKTNKWEKTPWSNSSYEWKKHHGLVEDSKF